MKDKLMLFGSHIASLGEMETDSSCSLHFYNGVRVKVKYKEEGFYFDEQYVGNLYGAIQEYAKICSEKEVRKPTQNKWLDTAREILKAVLESDSSKKFGGKEFEGMGSGGHAREFGNDNYKCYKIVTPGDDKHTVFRQLCYLLGDLAVDLGLPEELRDTIYGREG